MPKRADNYCVGEEFKPLTFTVTPDFNYHYCLAVEGCHERYTTGTCNKPPLVHPALLIFYSNVTRSPSFYLPQGMAAVHAKEEIKFISPALVGKTFTVYWKVVEVYEKRGRCYQVKDTLMLDEGDKQILKRIITDTYFSGS